MIERLPYYYRKSKVVEELYTVVQKILDKISADISDEDLSLFITTTTDFTLHERDVGITAAKGSDEDRRSKVIAKLQGNGVLTVEALKALVGAFGEKIDVQEDYSKYIVRLVFSNREGQPKNINEILSAVDEVKPAHICIGTNYVRNPTDTLSVGGLLHTVKTITFMPVDVTRHDELINTAYIGGNTKAIKTINLEEE